MTLPSASVMINSVPPATGSENAIKKECWLEVSPNPVAIPVLPTAKMTPPVISAVEL